VGGKAGVEEARMQIIKLPDGRKYSWFRRANMWEEWDVCDERWDPYYEDTDILERLADAEKILRKVTEEPVASLVRNYFAKKVVKNETDL